jgi:hypothetical protein
MLINHLAGRLMSVDVIINISIDDYILTQFGYIYILYIIY